MNMRGLFHLTLFVAFALLVSRPVLASTEKFSDEDFSLDGHPHLGEDVERDLDEDLEVSDIDFDMQDESLSSLRDHFADVGFIGAQEELEEFTDDASPTQLLQEFASAPSSPAESRDEDEDEDFLSDLDVSHDSQAAEQARSLALAAARRTVAAPSQEDKSSAAAAAAAQALRRVSVPLPAQEVLVEAPVETCTESINLRQTALAAATTAVKERQTQIEALEAAVANARSNLLGAQSQSLAAQKSFASDNVVREQQLSTVDRLLAAAQDGSISSVNVDITTLPSQETVSKKLNALKKTLSKPKFELAAVKSVLAQIRVRIVRESERAATDVQRKVDLVSQATQFKNMKQAALDESLTALEQAKSDVSASEVSLKAIQTRC